MSSAAPIARSRALQDIARFPTQRVSDEKLVEGAARGDREAIAAVWDRYVDFVRGVLRGALGHDAALDDLVQDVFVGFVRGAKNITDRSGLRPYLAGVAIRLAALEIRRRQIRRIVGLSPTGELPEQPAPPEDSDHRRALEALDRVLAGLRKRRRLAFVLRHVHGLEMRETASALDISVSTLRRELLKARQQILSRAAREPDLAEFLARFQGES